MSSSTRTLYVGNLPGDIREREVEDLFYKYGPIARIDLKVPPRRRVYAFVEFKEAQDAEAAIRGRNGYDFDGYILWVELAYGGRGNSSLTDRYNSHENSRGGGGDDGSSRMRCRSRSRSRSFSRSPSRSRRKSPKAKSSRRSKSRSKSASPRPSASQSRSQSHYKRKRDLYEQSDPQVSRGVRDLREKQSGQPAVSAPAKPVAEKSKPARTERALGMKSFLQALHLEKYSTTFQTEEIYTMRILRHLSDHELELIGIKEWSEREKIRMALEAIDRDASTSRPWYESIGKFRS